MRRDLARAVAALRPAGASTDDDDLIARSSSPGSVRTRGRPRRASYVAGLANWTGGRTRPHLDAGRSRRAPPGGPTPARRHAGPALGHHGDLGQHVVAPGVRPAAADPGAAAPDRQRLAVCSWTSWSEAPPTGDPRIHPRPVNRHGRDVRPAVATARRPAGVQGPHPTAHLDPPAAPADPRGGRGSTCCRGSAAPARSARRTWYSPAGRPRSSTRALPHSDRGGRRQERGDPRPLRTAG